MIKKQFTLYLQNRPGQLAEVARQLADANVNIEGISVSESTDVGLVQLVVDKPDKAKSLFSRIRIPYTEQSIAILPLKNRPGALAAVTAKLAEHGININYVYGTTCSCTCKCNCHSNVILSAASLKKVQALWNSAK